MDISDTVTALAALAQATRLKVFRLLMEAGPDGLPAMQIAERLDVRKNLMSTHLSILAQAGLTTVRRDGRQIFHAVDLTATRRLLAFLVQDCCKGQAETCASLLDEILPLERCPEPSTTDKHAQS